ncbi:MAG: hypothetical protein HQ495_11030, partial [Alphaproteobacteria bacterium]|nr:hypothetical protein [Alphaproteobacteria bacterium]
MNETTNPPGHTPTPEDIDQHIEPHMMIETVPTKRKIDLIRKFKQEKLFAFGVIIVALAIFLAFFGPIISPYDPNFATGNVSVSPPNILDWPGLFVDTVFLGATPPHWFGTDNSGLDIFSRTISAPRTDHQIALIAALLSMAVGTILGLLAGFFKNFLTEILMRTSDLLQAFPVFITAMILVALSGRSTGNIVVA